MKALWLALLVFLLLAAIAVVGWLVVSTPPDLAAAEAIDIVYSVRDTGGSHSTKLDRMFSVTDPAQVREILSALDVQGSKPNVPWRGFALKVPYGQIRFRFPGGDVCRAWVRRAESLEIERIGLRFPLGGNIHIGPGFVGKVNAVLSRHEGRPIDILERNE